MKSRRGAATHNANSSAILIIIVTVLIILYILFLPPSDRAELLGENSGGSSTGSGSSTSSSSGSTVRLPSMTLMTEQIGELSAFTDDEKEHVVPSFTISTSAESTSIKEVKSLYVKSSTFETLIKNVTFNVDRDLTKDLKFSFNIGDVADGRLMIVLNGEQIMNSFYDAKTSQYVVLPKDLIMQYNVLTIGVSSTGWAFWDANEYLLTDLSITGEVTDLSSSESEQMFTLSKEEVKFLDRGVLKFYADCTQRVVGKLRIKMNGETIFNSVADCGSPNTIELDKNILREGKNELSFLTEQGAYVVSDIIVKTYLEEAIKPIYYFDLDNRYFTSYTADKEDSAICGKIDNYCPKDCSADQDKDCCFENNDNFWCDTQPQYTGDRCVSYVTASTCGRCLAGYEDYKGNIAEACEDTCGNDDDNYCPLGCAEYYDKDCCFEDDDNFWCDNAPLGLPLTAVCRAGIEYDERASCSSTYYNDDGDRLTPPPSTTNYDDLEEKLRDEYTVKIYFDFPNKDYRGASLIVNGRETGFETTSISYEKDITAYVQADSNSIQIIPRKDMDITQMRVRVMRT